MNLGIPRLKHEIHDRQKLVMKYLPDIYAEFEQAIAESNNEHAKERACLRLLKDKRLELTEYDKLHLIMGYYLSAGRENSLNEVLRFYDEFHLQEYDIDTLMDAVKELGAKIKASTFPVIRAKLACKELLAGWIGKKAVPELLKVTSRYAMCYQVQLHISEVKADILRNSRQTQEEAKALLKLITKAIQGNLKRKREQYPASLLMRQHAVYKEIIIEAKQGSKKARSCLKMLTMPHFNALNKTLLDDILNRDESPDSLALQMLKRRYGNIPLRTIQGKLKKKAAQQQSIRVGNEALEDS